MSSPLLCSVLSIMSPQCGNSVVEPGRTLIWVPFRTVLDLPKLRRMCSLDAHHRVKDLQELLHQFVTVISFVACVRLFEGENSEKDRFEFDGLRFV